MESAIPSKDKTFSLAILLSKHTSSGLSCKERYWNSFSPPIQRRLFYDTNMVFRLKFNCQSSKSSSSSGMEWGILFPFALWTIWLYRNNTAFGRPHLQKDSKTEAVAKATKFLHLGINGKLIRAKSKIQVCWHHPSLSWFKLNTYGSSLGNLGLAGGGGLIRNDKGEWVKGLERAIGSTTSVAAEL